MREGQGTGGLKAQAYAELSSRGRRIKKLQAEEEKMKKEAEEAVASFPHNRGRRIKKLQAEAEKMKEG